MLETRVMVVDANNVARCVFIGEDWRASKLAQQMSNDTSPQWVKQVFTEPYQTKKQP